MTDDQIKQITERFLAWKLPADFLPDAGITFVPDYNVGTDFQMRHKPTGNNLLTYTQAEKMVRDIIGDFQPLPEYVGAVVAALRDILEWWPENSEHIVRLSRGEGFAVGIQRGRQALALTPETYDAVR